MKIALSILLFFSLFGFLELFPILGYGMTVSDINIILVGVVFLKRIFWNGDELIVTKNYASLAYFFMIIFVLLSAVTPIFKGEEIQLIQFIKTTSHFFIYVIIMVVAILYPVEKEFFFKIFKIWLIASIFINLFGIYQLFARIYDLPFAFFEFQSFSSQLRTEGNENVLEQASTKIEKFYRATSIFPEPSALAGFNLQILILTLVPILHKSLKIIKNKLLNSIIILLNMLSLMLTYSLSAVGVLAFLIITYFTLSNTKSVINFFKLIFAFFVILIIADTILINYTEISVLGLIFERVSSALSTLDPSEYAYGESIPQRVLSISEAVRTWTTQPITGIGLGLLHFNSDKVSFTDSTFFMILSQMGIFAFITFSFMFINMLYNLFIHTKNKITNTIDSTMNIIILYFTVMISVMLFFTSNQFVTSNVWPIISVLFFVINQNYIKRNKYFPLKLIKYPLKNQFNYYIAEYLNRKNIINQNK